jgi:hypothetical protein
LGWGKRFGWASCAVQLGAVAGSSLVASLLFSARLILPLHQSLSLIFFIMDYRSGLRPVKDKVDSKSNKMAIDEATLENQMKNLGNVTKNTRAAKKIARNKDTINTLLEALKTKPKFTKMVEYSIECLKNLAIDEVSVEEMLDTGVLEVLKNVQRLNPYNEKIQQIISKTLAAFSLNDKLAEVVAEKMGKFYLCVIPSSV